MDNRKRGGEDGKVKGILKRDDDKSYEDRFEFQTLTIPSFYTILLNTMPYYWSTGVRTNNKFSELS